VGAVLLTATSAQAQILFEADSGSGNIYEFASDGARSTFASGLGLISGLAFNNAGNLFVADPPAGSIYEFTPGGVQSTFATGLFLLNLTCPMAFDGAGDLFMSDGVRITEITPGGAQSTFALGGFSGLAFDSSGNLFASCGSSGNLSQSDKIFKFSPGGAQSTFLSGLTDPCSLAFDRAGDLFVPNYTSGIINKITPGGVQSTFASGLPDPLTLTCDRAGDLFVATAGNGQGSAVIYKFTPGGAQSTFASGLYGPIALAFQPVPEPSLFGLLAIGATALLVRCRRRNLLRCYAACCRTVCDKASGVRHRSRLVRQCLEISLVALWSQSLSAAKRIISTAANHFGALAAGSPKGVNLPTAIKI